jgi:hypothetical protein
MLRLAVIVLILADARDYSVTNEAKSVTNA